MFVAHEFFLSDVVDEYSQDTISTDGSGNWHYPPCEILKLKHHLHS